MPLRPPVFELTGAAAEGLEGLIEASKEREKGREKKKRHARNKSDIGAAFATLGLGGIGIDEASTLRVLETTTQTRRLHPPRTARAAAAVGAEEAPAATRTSRARARAAASAWAAAAAGPWGPPRS